MLVFMLLSIHFLNNYRLILLQCPIRTRSQYTFVRSLLSPQSAIVCVMWDFIHFIMPVRTIDLYDVPSKRFRYCSHTHSGPDFR